MKKYTNFDEMFHDDDYVSQEEREQINFQVELIGKIIAAREAQGLSQRDWLNYLELNSLLLQEWKA